MCIVQYHDMMYVMRTYRIPFRIFFKYKHIEILDCERNNKYSSSILKRNSVRAQNCEVDFEEISI